MSRLFALTVALAVVSSLLGCGSRITSSPAPTPQEKPPLATSTEPTAAAAYYLDGARAVSVSLKNPSIAYWEVTTDVSPTASSAAAALAFMGRKYANQGRAMVLRISVPYKPEPAPHMPTGTSTFLFWNPTDTTLTVGFFPPGDLPPHGLYFYRGRDEGHPPGRVLGTVPVSQVATETDLLPQLRAAGL